MKKFIFSVPHYFKGTQVKFLVVASTYKTASDLLGVSTYYLKTYGYRNEYSGDLPSHTCFVKLEHSGELPYIFSSDEIKTPMKKCDFEIRMNEWRKKYPTHFDTVMAFTREFK